MGNHGNKGILIELVVYGVYIAQAFPFFAAFKKKKEDFRGNSESFRPDWRVFLCKPTTNQPSTSQVLISFQGIRFRSVRHLSGRRRLHQRARLALSGHHDGHGSRARQRGGAGLWGCGQWRHLWLGPRGPVGGGYRRAP